jgi:3-dehydroquinate dehydratase/shikimate dehydrogenase
MICISIAQESRRFALVDMLNAAPQCDLLEVRLDRFDRAPDVGELLGLKSRPPVIMSCRRVRDGGQWQGGEDERLALLRQCIISKAEYVEIELDAADRVRKFPPSQRVISYTNLEETPANLAEIYAEAQTKSPDVIKLVTRAHTPEEAWPLVQILAKPAVPTVVVGLGKPGVMLTVLARKMGAPWAYAALERGMEAYPDQPTVRDLETVYHYRAIGRATRLVGVTGFSEPSYVTVALLNTALAHLGLNARCLPLEVGNLRLFRKVLEAVKLTGVVVDAEHRGALLAVATKLDTAAQHAQAADLIVRQGDEWHGHNLLPRAAGAALEATLRARSPADRPLEGRSVMLVSVNGLTRAMAERIQRGGGIPIIASRDRDAAHELAQALGCRYVPFEALYSTLHDVLVVCGEEPRHPAAKGKAAEGGVHSGYLKPSMTVLDLTTLPRKSALLRDAEQRGCGVVSPRQVLLEQVARQVKVLAGQDVAREPVKAVLDVLLEDEDMGGS